MNSRKSQCAHCHKRTTNNPERCVLVKSHTPVYGCVSRLYGLLCAECFKASQKRRKVKNISVVTSSHL